MWESGTPSTQTSASVFIFLSVQAGSVFHIPYISTHLLSSMCLLSHRSFLFSLLLTSQNIPQSSSWWWFIDELCACVTLSWRFLSLRPATLQSVSVWIIVVFFKLRVSIQNALSLSLSLCHTLTHAELLSWFGWAHLSWYCIHLRFF